MRSVDFGNRGAAPVSDLRPLIERLVAAGVDAITAAEVIAEAAMIGAANSAKVAPESPEERRKRISRESSARHRASPNVTSASPNVTEKTSVVVTESDGKTSPNVTKRHDVTESDCATNNLSFLDSMEESKKEKIDTPHRRGSRISDEWEPSQADRLFAEGRGFSDGQIDDMAARFLNHFLSAPGAKGLKSNWSATWRNWVISPYSPPPVGRNGKLSYDPDAFV